MMEADHRVFCKDKSIAANLTSSQPNAPESGLLARTRVETDKGWWRVEELQEGDLIYTRDGGLKPVRTIERLHLEADDYDGTRSIVLIPAGVLDNCVPFFMLPEQRILIESPHTEATLGAPFALVPVRALVGHKGITPLHLPMPTDVYRLYFDEEEVIRINTGVMAHCPPEGEIGTYYQEVRGERAERLFRLAGLGFELGVRSRKR